MWPFNIKKTEQKSGRRAYSGAMIGRLTSDWVTMTTSIDSEIKSSLVLLRNRSRSLFANNDYGKNFARILENNIIGPNGIPFQAQVRMQRGGKLDDATNTTIELAWEKWCKKDSCHAAGKLNLTEIAQTLVKTAASDGEFIVRIITQRMGKSKVPMSLELIEADRLDESMNGRAQNGNEVRMGVEVNQWGRPTAYYFLHRTPGDINSVAIATRAESRIRIPAEEILHEFICDRMGQSRGVPWVASAIMRLHQMGGYEEAEVIAARASASTMGFIESPDGEPVPDDVVGDERVTDFSPGVFKYLAPGEKVNVPQLQRPGGQFDPFIRSMLRGVSAGIGSSYETLSRDYSQSNYSSSRLALLDDRDNWKRLQGWMIRNFYQVIYERWLELAVLSGELKLRDYETKPEQYQCVKWCPRGWSWVDPAKEVAAYKEAVRNGFKTVSDVVSESGGDIEDLIAQREREIKLAKDKGLVFDSDPDMVDGAGAKQMIPSDNTTIAAPKKPKAQDQVAADA